MKKLKYKLLKDWECEAVRIPECNRIDLVFKAGSIFHLKSKHHIKGGVDDFKVYNSSMDILEALKEGLIGIVK